MPGRSTVEAIFAMRQIIEKRTEFERPFYCVFIDFFKAFDCICREALWQRMAELGVPARDLRLFKLLYGNTSSCVRIGDALSRRFMICSGVRQGCSIAPELFSVVMDVVMTKTMERIGEIFKLGDTPISDLCYADDVVLLADTEAQLRGALEILAEEAAKFGLFINWSKTKVVLFAAPPDAPRPSQLQVSASSAQYVDSFTYLGATLSVSGNSRADVSKRIGLSSAAMASFDALLWHRPLSLKTKLRVYHALVLSLLLYGVETWTLTVDMSCRLAAFHTKCLRRILGLRWIDRVSNTEVLRRCETSDLRNILDYRRLRWFGHVARLPDDRPARLCLLSQPVRAGWRLPAHGLRLRWYQQINRSLRNLHDIADTKRRHPPPPNVGGRSRRMRSDQDLIPVDADAAISSAAVYNPSPLVVHFEACLKRRCRSTSSGRC